MWYNIPKVDKQRAFIKADDWRPAKGIYNDDAPIFNWIIEPLSQNDKALLTSQNIVDSYRAKTRYKSLDSAIMELADDIAYAVHDLEDAIATDVLSLDDWLTHALPHLQALNYDWLNTLLKSLTERLFSKHEHERKDAIGELVNTFIIHIHLDIKTMPLNALF